MSVRAPGRCSACGRFVQRLRWRHCLSCAGRVEGRAARRFLLWAAR